MTEELKELAKLYQIVEDGESTNVFFYCTRYDKQVDMNWCEANCPKYSRCGQIAQANDVCKAVEDHEDAINRSVVVWRKRCSCNELLYIERPYIDDREFPSCCSCSKYYRFDRHVIDGK